MGYCIKLPLDRREIIRLAETRFLRTGPYRVSVSQDASLICSERYPEYRECDGCRCRAQANKMCHQGHHRDQTHWDNDDIQIRGRGPLGSRLQGLRFDSRHKNTGEPKAYDYRHF